MINQQYIHINEAVKKREKTRQTFYNYIHKGLVRTKKINNKVYLYHDDVEQLMQGFIPDAVQPTKIAKTSEAQEDSVPTVKETNKQKAGTLGSQDLNNIQKDMARLHKQYYSLKDDILQAVQSTKQEVLFDTKRLTDSVEQHIMLHLEKDTKKTSGKRKGLINRLKKLELQNKKQSFRIGYCALVLVNLLVITYMI